MNACVVTQLGGPEVLEMREMPLPVPLENDLLIEVHAAALNPVDFKIRQGAFAKNRPLPFILGFDVSGVVREVGPAVTSFKCGDEVYAMPSLVRNGSNAEFVCVDARTAALKPRSLSHVEAAALPLVSLTAMEAFQRASLAEGETVLIHAGGGGVGHLAIQIASRLHHCHVITTASRKESIELCCEADAKVIINHQISDFVECVRVETEGRGCPLVFDTVGGDTFDRSLDCVAVNGRLITIVGSPSNLISQSLFRKNATLYFQFVGMPTMHGIHLEQQGAALRTMAGWVDRGLIKPHIDKIIGLHELAEGHRLQQAGHVTGKIAIRVKT